MKNSVLRPAHTRADGTAGAGVAQRGHIENASIDRSNTGVGIGPCEIHRPAAKLADSASTGNYNVEINSLSDGVCAIEGQRRIIDDGARRVQRAGSTAIAQLQRAAGDRGVAGVEIRTRDRHDAGPLLDNGLVEYLPAEQQVHP